MIHVDFMFAHFVGYVLGNFVINLIAKRWLSSTTSVEVL